MHDYIVRNGESIYSIAYKFSVSAEALVRINGLNSSGVLYEGQRIKVPVVIMLYKPRRGESMEAISESLQVPLTQFTFRADKSEIIIHF
ncbi:MAG: LysM peptidoglycan-binding domain-containing protein [Oscillospiraceae bacterium]